MSNRTSVYMSDSEILHRYLIVRFAAMFFYFQ